MVAIASHNAEFVRESEDKQQLMQTVELEVGGMTCVACASAIKDCLVKERGVEGVEVYLESDTASIYYDPSVVSSNDIVHKIERAGFSAKISGDDSKLNVKRLQARTIVSVFFGVLEFVICMLCMHTVWYNNQIIGRLSFGLLLETILGTSAIMTVGKDILLKSLKSVKQGQPGMDLLVSVGVSVAYMYSMVNIALLSVGSLLGGMTVFETVTTLIMSTTAGKYLELKAKQRCSRYLRNLEKIVPKYSIKEVDGHIITVPTLSIVKGDRVWVGCNGRVPVDGISLDPCQADEALLTGESEPVNKAIGDQIFAGSIVLSDTTIICTGTGKATLLGKIARSMKANNERKPKLQAASDVLAKYFVYFILSFTTFIAILWIGLGYSGLAPAFFYKMGGSIVVSAVRIAMTVLTIACPCALGLAAPMAMVVGKGRAAKRGIIISNSQAIDNCQSVTTIAFDKTGTLTVGRPEVIDFVHVNKALPVETIWAICHQAETRTTHLIGRALKLFCESCKSDSLICTSFRQVDGGVMCTVDSSNVLIGSAKLLAQSGVHVTVDSPITEQESAGKTTIYMSVNEEIAGIFVVGDQLRCDAVGTIRQLEQDGKKLCIISGDNWQTTKAVADVVGIREYYAQKSPFEKAEIISVKQDLGEGVCFVGDGINDSPAMGLTTVSIAMGNATDLTANSADIVLLKPTLANVRTAMFMCEAIRKKIVINFMCAASYNIIAIPLASGLFLKYGIYVSPTYSGIFMAMSSLLVLINSLLL